MTVLDTALDKRAVVEDVRPGCEGDHAQLVIAEAIINPNERSIPVEFLAPTPKKRRVWLGLQRLSQDRTRFARIIVAT